jgi:hypothetical protein
MFWRDRPCQLAPALRGGAMAYVPAQQAESMLNTLMEMVKMGGCRGNLFSAIVSKY